MTSSATITRITISQTIGADPKDIYISDSQDDGVQRPHYDRSARCQRPRRPHQRHAGQEPAAPPSRRGASSARTAPRGPTVPARRGRPPPLQRQARHDPRARVRGLGSRARGARGDDAGRRARRGARCVPDDARARRGLRTAQVRGHVVERPVGRRALRPRRPLADARRARGRRLGDGLAPGDARLAGIARADRRRRPPLPDAARARRARRRSSEEAMEGAAASGSGEATLLVGVRDAPLRGAVGEPGHGRPRPRRPARA